MINFSRKYIPPSLLFIVLFRSFTSLTTANSRVSLVCYCIYGRIIVYVHVVLQIDTVDATSIVCEE